MGKTFLALADCLPTATMRALAMVVTVFLTAKLYAGICLDADLVVVHIVAFFALAAVITIVVWVAHADGHLGVTLVALSRASEVAVARRRAYFEVG